MRHLILFLSFHLVLIRLMAAGPVKIHSHNDYQKEIPLFMAYAQKASSVECDLYLQKDGALLTGHDQRDLDGAMTLERLYLEPLKAIMEANGGCPWMSEPERHLTLMVEDKLKKADQFLEALTSMLKRYPQVFDPQVNPHAVGILVTGWVFPEDFSIYPSYIRYDFQYDGTDWDRVPREKMERVGLISMNFRKLSSWDGTGTMRPEEKARLQEVIDFAHKKGKPVRFWGAPDTPEGWNFLLEMGVDVLNTDHIQECAAAVWSR